MNIKTFAGHALATALVLTLSACGESLTEINNNPNAPTDVDASFLLPQAIRAGVEQTFGGGQMLSHTAIWPQHAVELQYPDEEEGIVRASRMQLYWNNYYAGSLRDIQTVVDKGAEQSEPNIEGVGLIWKSWLFHLVTDFWGDAPYSQALTAGRDGGTTTPAYDPQQQIYQGMLQDLAQGAALVGTGTADFGKGDILYDNDMAAWGRFANSMRMRLAMRLSEVDPGAAETAFVAAYNAGPFTSNADNAMLAWPGDPYRNPLFENWQGRDDHGISATMVDTLTSLADPRLELYAEPAAEDGAYRGLQNGDITPALSLAWYSRIGDHWRADGAATPTAIMTYSEVLFLAAEAAFLGWIPDDPATLYEEGIRANMAQWNAANAPTATEIDDYLAQTVVQYDPTRGRDQIHLQQWLGLFMNGAEAWAHVRRTDMPDLTPGPDLTLSRIPVRFYYPDLEQSLNAANLQDALSRQGGGLDLVTTVWWDIN